MTEKQNAMEINPTSDGTAKVNEVPVTNATNNNKNNNIAASANEPASKKPIFGQPGARPSNDGIEASRWNIPTRPQNNSFSQPQSGLSHSGFRQLGFPKSDVSRQMFSQQRFSNQSPVGGGSIFTCSEPPSANLFGGPRALTAGLGTSSKRAREEEKAVITSSDSASRKLQKKDEGRRVEIVSASKVTRSDSDIVSRAGENVQARGTSILNKIVETENAWTSKSSGSKAAKVVTKQMQQMQWMVGEDAVIQTTMSSVRVNPLARVLSNVQRGPNKSKRGLILGPPDSEGPVSLAGPSSKSDAATCLCCSRTGHKLKHCVGKPNAVHGDVPMCTLCGAWGGGVSGGIEKNPKKFHQFDECHHFLEIFPRFRGIALERMHLQPVTMFELRTLTPTQFVALLEALVICRLNKTPVRTRVLCFLDVIFASSANGYQGQAMPGFLQDTAGPWRKENAKEQCQKDGPKPWDTFDYSKGKLTDLPDGHPLDSLKWEHFVKAYHKGQLGKQVFDAPETSSVQPASSEVAKLHAEIKELRRRLEAKVDADTDMAGVDMPTNPAPPPPVVPAPQIAQQHMTAANIAPLAFPIIAQESPVGPAQKGPVLVGLQKQLNNIAPLAFPIIAQESPVIPAQKRPVLVGLQKQLNDIFGDPEEPTE